MRSEKKRVQSPDATTAPALLASVLDGVLTAFVALVGDKKDGGSICRLRDGSADSKKGERVAQCC